MNWVVILGCLFSLTAAASPIAPLMRLAGAVRPGSIDMPSLSPSHQYSLLYSLSPLHELGPKARVMLEVRQGETVLASKTLHAGDPDYYVQFRVPAAGAAKLSVRSTEAPVKYTLQVNQWPL